MEELQQVELILNNRGENVHVIVDLLTANELLNNILKADQFIGEIRQEGSSSTRFQDPVPGTSQSNNNCGEKIYKIWTSKRPTQEDVEATQLFLKLRMKYADKFKDRKSIKSHLSQKISNEIVEMGVFVGEDKEAVEKIRLKLSNLQKQYLLHIKHIKSTGESQEDPPPFFDLIHGILGGKDKSNPTNLQDSLEDVTKEAGMDCEEETQGTSEELKRLDEENGRDNTQNRFKKSSHYQSQSHTQRPKSTNMKLLELAASESEDRKKTHVQIRKFAGNTK